MDKATSASKESPEQPRQQPGRFFPDGFFDPSLVRTDQQLSERPVVARDAGVSPSLPLREEPLVFVHHPLYGPVSDLGLPLFGSGV